MKNSLNGEVVTYYLSPEELEKIRQQSKERGNRNRRAIEWRWPTSRRKGKETV